MGDVMVYGSDPFDITVVRYKDGEHAGKFCAFYTQEVFARGSTREEAIEALCAKLRGMFSNCDVHQRVCVPFNKVLRPKKGE
jgi:hypothetical protein